MNTQISVGLRVQVLKDQRNRLGPPKYPGRTGEVKRLNSVGGMDHGGLWYVLLDKTNRAAAREETFWGEELLEVPPSPTSTSLAAFHNPRPANG